MSKRKSQVRRLVSGSVAMFQNSLAGSSELQTGSSIFDATMDMLKAGLVELKTKPKHVKMIS